MTGYRTPGSIERPGRRRSRPVSRILCRPRAAVAIHLGPPSPATSCGLPGGRPLPGGRATHTPCLALLRTGFAEPHRSPDALVGSYPTLSPSPPVTRRRSAFCGTVRGSPRLGVSPASCPVESGLSSTPIPRGRGHPAGSSASPSTIERAGNSSCIRRAARSRAPRRGRPRTTTRTAFPTARAESHASEVAA